MKSYLRSLLSYQKFTHSGVSWFAAWDSCSTFTSKSEVRRFAKLKNSRIGRYSRINPGCSLHNTVVGNFSAIGRGTSVGLGFHPLNFVSTQNIFYKPNNMTNQWVKPIDLPHRPIIIGSDVWIGNEALILDGVTVGHGAVIGARAVVTKDVPPYAVAVGVPARVIKVRFAPEVVRRLLEIAWWDFDDQMISHSIEFFREPLITVKVIDHYFGSQFGHALARAEVDSPGHTMNGQ